MIKWLAPLGFLGLLSLIVLMLIYIIKPRYQQKIVSSTVAWRILLKRKKKKIPTQPLKMIIILICQILALTSLAFIMANPKYFSKQFLAEDAARIVIVDASGSMLAKYAGGEGETRFDRAKSEIKSRLGEWLSDDKGTVSLIYAGKKAQYLISDATRDNLADIERELDEMECCFGPADVKGALELAEERLKNNPLIKIFLYTGTDYGNLGSAVTVRNLANIQSEWNVGVLGCTPGMEFNEYVFNVNVGAYGKISKECSLYLDIKGAKNGESSVSVPRLHQVVDFAVDTESINYAETKMVKFKASDPDCGGREGLYFTSFEEATVGFEGLNDSMPIDDSIKVYGGLKDEIKVQYYSTDANSFYYLSLLFLHDPMGKTRDIQYYHAKSVSELYTKGFDFYIFEHALPLFIGEQGFPRDGVIILSNPNDLSMLGIELGDRIMLDKMNYFESNVSHPLLQYIAPEEMGVTAYKKVVSYDPSFRPILFCNGDPVMLVKETATERFIVMPFSINWSNLANTSLLTKLLYNMITYYMPLTVSEYEFEADGELAMSCKGASITVTDPSGDTETYTDFPNKIELPELGTYTLTTNYAYEKEHEVRKVFVKMPNSESGIFKSMAIGIKLDNTEIWKELGSDVFMYLAIAILALAVVEWCLQLKDVY